MLRNSACDLTVGLPANAPTDFGDSTSFWMEFVREGLLLCEGE